MIDRLDLAALEAGNNLLQTLPSTVHVHGPAEASTSAVASSHGRETSDLSAEVRMETLTDWTVPGMPAPLLLGTAYQLSGIRTRMADATARGSRPACLS
jgi:hypothetical protein